MPGFRPLIAEHGFRVAEVVRLQKPPNSHEFGSRKARCSNAHLGPQTRGPQRKKNRDNVDDLTASQPGCRPFLTKALRTGADLLADPELANDVEIPLRVDAAQIIQQRPPPAD